MKSLTLQESNEKIKGKLLERKFEEKFENSTKEAKFVLEWNRKVF